MKPDQSCDTTSGSCPTCRVCPGTWILLALVLGVLLYTMLKGVGARSDAFVSPGERQPLQSLSGEDLGGRIWKLEDHRGKVVLVNVWATWCPPCREEMPDLVSLAKEYADRDVAFVGVSIDMSGPEPVRKFADHYGIPYPVLMGAKTTQLQEVSSVPVTILVDREGRVARWIEGAVTAGELKPDLERLLAEAPPAMVSR